MDMLSGHVATQSGMAVGAVGGQASVVPQVGVTQQVQASTPSSVGVPDSQVLFTQEQVNSIVGGRVNPLNQRVSDLTAQLAQSQQVANSYLNELNGYKQREMARSAGVPEMFINYAVFEASKLAVDGKEFSAALNEFVQANSQLFVNPQTVGQQVAKAPAQGVMQNAAQPNQAMQMATPAGQQVQFSMVGKVAGQGTQSVPAASPVGMQLGVSQPQMVQQVQAPAQLGSSGVVGVGGSVTDVNLVDSAVTALLTKKGVVKKIGG